MSRKRLLTGDRPTGKLHLGHYVGSLKERVRLQHEYESYILIADYHMLTTKSSIQEIAEIAPNIQNIMLDYLSIGLDPTIVTFYLQSQVVEVTEISLLLSMMTTVSRLQRLPSLKDMARAANMQEMTLGLLGYPVLQSADILLPCAHIVPIGKDNEAHIELTRELARKFNYVYNSEVFPVPEALLGEEKALVGIDGSAKMSKSLNNAIYLSDTVEEVNKKVMKMYTDPNRVSADVPGKVEGNPVFIYHAMFNTNTEEVQNLADRYTHGSVGDVEVKQKLANAINQFLEPIRERRSEYMQDTGLVEQILVEGTIHMREVAKETIMRMRKAMGLSGVWNRIRRKAEIYAKKQSNQ